MEGRREERREGRRADSFPSFSITVPCRCNSHMGKECVHIAIDVPRLNRRSECGYFSPCKQGRGLAKNGVQTLECINKDILNRTQRHPGTQRTTEGWGLGGVGGGQAPFAGQPLPTEPFLKGWGLNHAAHVTGHTGRKMHVDNLVWGQAQQSPLKSTENAAL